MPICLDALYPSLRLPLRRSRVALPADRHNAAMRTGADAGVLAITPVGQVVPALFAGRGVVGDLVRRQARLLRQLLGQLVKVVRHLAVRHTQLAARVQRREGCLGLDCQLVERQVPARERQPVATTATTPPTAIAALIILVKGEPIDRSGVSGPAIQTASGTAGSVCPGLA